MKKMMRLVKGKKRDSEDINGVSSFGSRSSLAPSGAGGVNQGNK